MHGRYTNNDNNHNDNNQTTRCYELLVPNLTADQDLGCHVWGTTIYERPETRTGGEDCG